MSIYPDWIGVDVGTGAIVLIDGYSVSLEEIIYDVAIEPDFSVALDDNDYEVEYG
jgi:hypothetical protein|tara:strand:- start:181 stop:345 length:165 start_codon:yes stop_codon:yes gene_type:complete